MVKMQKEEIDNIITESFIKIVKEEMINSFTENIKKLSQLFKETGLNENDCNIATYCFACIQTAQVNTINTMREVLYKLCCEDDSTME